MHNSTRSVCLRIPKSEIRSICKVSEPLGGRSGGCRKQRKHNLLKFFFFAAEATRRVASRREASALRLRERHGLRTRTWRARDGRSSRASCGLLLSIVRLSLVDRGTRQQTAAFVRLISAGAAVLRSQLHLVSIILATASMTIINTATATFARTARSLCPDS